MKEIKLGIIVSIFFSFITGNILSQNDSPLQLGTDLMSRYIWRGIDLGGESPGIQPSLKYNWSAKDSAHTFTVGAWGAYNTNTSNQEVDLYFTYTFKNIIGLTLTDYYFPGNIYYTNSQEKYFNYNSNSTGHVFEPALTFNGTDKIPFTLMFAIIVYGDDVRKINNDGTTGNICMSKYIEAGYRTTIKGVDFNAFIGATPDDPHSEKSLAGYYGGNKSAGVINLGVKFAKKVKITNDYSVPFQASLITNPEAEKIYIVFGISF